MSRDDRSPQTWPSAKPLAARIGSKTLVRRRGCDVAQPGRCRWLRSTKVAYQTSSPFRPLNDHTAGSLFEIVPGKTLDALDIGEHAQMQLAKSGVEIGFYLLQGSQFRFLRT